MNYKTFNAVSVIFTILALLFTSCSNKEDGKRHLQASMGQQSEVILVMPNDHNSGDLADSLNSVLTSNVPGLNQGEDYFRLTKIPASLDKTEAKKMHSRVVVKIDPTLKKAEMGTATDVYVRPQLEVMLAAPSVEEMMAFLGSHGQKICDLLLDAQLKNQVSFLKTHNSSKVRKDLKEVLGYSIDAPEEIQFTKKGEDFLWGSTRTNEKQLNMVFYRIPYGGQDMLSATDLAALRDSVMQVNVPGSKPDQWMETVWEEEQPIVAVNTIKVHGHEVSEMRGLWQMRHGAMGGPFVSLFRLDKEKNEIVVAEGFVFSPSTPKRDLVRRLEASLRTFSGL